MTEETKIAETVTKEGTHVEVFEKEKGRAHPVVEMATKGMTGGTITGETVEKSVEKTKEAIEEEKQTGRLDVHGQKLAGDVEEMLTSGERLFKEKGRDELLGEIYEESRASTMASAEQAKRVAERPELEKARISAQDLYDAIRNLFTTFAKSGEFRELISDNLELLKSLLTQLQEKVISKEETKEMTLPEISDESIEHFSNVLFRLGNNPEYQRGVDNLYTIWDQLYNLGWSLKEQEGATPEQLHGRKALNAAHLFLETFTGPQDLDKFKKTFWSLWEDINEDKEMKDSLCHLKDFLQDCIRNPQKLQDESTRKELRSTLERCRNLIQQEKYRNKFDKLVDRARLLAVDIQEEETVKDLRMKSEKFIRDFAFNKEGKPDLWVMDESFRDLRQLMVPIIRKHLEEVPIDRIEIHNPQYDARIENVVFSAAELFPENIRMKTKSVSDIGVALGSTEDRTFMKMKLEAFGIKPHFKDVKFYYLRKSFPKMEDYGVADVNFNGNGMNIAITWNLLARAGLNPHVSLTKIKVTIDKLNIRIQEEQTRHYILDKFATSMLNRQIKKRLCREIAVTLQESLKPVNEEVNSWLASRPMDQLKQAADARMKEVYEAQQRQREYEEAKTKEEKEATKEEEKPTPKEELMEEKRPEEQMEKKEEKTVEEKKEEPKEEKGEGFKEEEKKLEEQAEYSEKQGEGVKEEEKPAPTEGERKEETGVTEGEKEPLKEMKKPSDIPEPSPEEGVPEPRKVT